MEAVRKSYSAFQSFIVSVIEWRSAATAPYFMWSVFYLNKETQLQLLMSLAAGVFGWDVLLSSTNNRSILFHVLTWPIRSLIRTVSVAAALYSALMLHHAELEKACWTAYATVALLIISPVWHCQQVPQKIGRCLYSAWTTTKFVIEKSIIAPFCSIYAVLHYVVMLKWLTVILRQITAKWILIKATVIGTWDRIFAMLRVSKNAVVNGIAYSILSTKTSILRIIHGITSGVRRFLISIKCSFFWSFIFCKDIAVNFALYLRDCIIFLVKFVINGFIYSFTTVKNAIFSVVLAFKAKLFRCLMALKNAVTSIILKVKIILYQGIVISKDSVYRAVISIRRFICDGIIRVQNLILDFYCAVIEWVKSSIIGPVLKIFTHIVQFLEYWLFAYWWPGFKSWLISYIVYRLQRLFNYFCYAFVYIVCCYWISPANAFLDKFFRLFYVYFQRSILMPSKIWAMQQVDKALILLKRMLHCLAVAVRDSIIWPFCLLTIFLIKQVLKQLQIIVFQPVTDILYRKYKICEDYVLIYFLGPVCQVFIDHIPEKSPFCDDTDTELMDLLPPGFTEDEESDREDKTVSRSKEERDFARGLKFPNVDGSDSSEDEFALKPKLRQKYKKKKLKAHPKDPIPTISNEKCNSARCETESIKQLKHSLSGSSHSDSLTSSSVQLSLDDADLRELDLTDFESGDQVNMGHMKDNIGIISTEGRRKTKKKEHSSDTCNVMENKL
ncbi:unnamed protein product [Thelazia callipaeda]|uniref:RING-type domain-containing protein n=1 Tax=Thelazia callipaeda TaxID=103827 RepID=A0A0N5D5J1_THECL|nr:unnamed protein product [Thelazia callipaeda]